MQFILSHRFEEDLRTPSALGVRDQILKTMYNLKVSPELGGLHVRSAQLGCKYCKVNRDWRILFEWEQGEPHFLRVVSHGVFDGLQRASLGGNRFAILEYDTVEPVSDQNDVHPEGSVSEESRRHTWDRESPADNPLRSYSTQRLRLLGVPRQMVDAVRDARSIEEVLALENLPDQTRVWFEQLATDPAEPLDDPFIVFKRATLEQLEGFCEGKIQELLLRLAPEQERFVNRDFEGPVLLRGCAGSGKSTVGMHRAIRLAEEGRHVLFITFSSILQQVTCNLVTQRLGEIPANLSIRSYTDWATQVLESAGESVDPISSAVEHASVERALRDVRNKVASRVLERPPGFFQNEIRRVIKGLGIDSFADYRQVARYGREGALSPIARRAVWKVFERYQSLLEAEGLRDWRDHVLRLQEILDQHPEVFAVDDIVVDEAQDLSPIELQALAQIGGFEGTRTCLILGDAAQSIYARGFTWKQANLDVIGRSFILRTNYRNTREVVRTASDLIERNEHLKRAGELTEIGTVERSGPEPVVVIRDNADQEVNFVVEQVLEYRERNVIRLRDIAILAPSFAAGRRFYDAFVVRDIPVDLWTEDRLDIDVLEETVKVMDLHLAKGLEFPVVFFVGMQSSVKTGDDEDEDAQIAYERERMLAYVGITRSAELLFLLANRAEMSPLIGELNYVEVRD